MGGLTFGRESIRIFRMKSIGEVTISAMQRLEAQRADIALAEVAAPHTPRRWAPSEIESLKRDPVLLKSAFDHYKLPEAENNRLGCPGCRRAGRQWKGRVVIEERKDEVTRWFCHACAAAAATSGDLNGGGGTIFDLVAAAEGRRFGKGNIRGWEFRDALRIIRNIDFRSRRGEPTFRRVAKGERRKYALAVGMAGPAMQVSTRAVFLFLSFSHPPPGKGRFPLTAAGLARRAARRMCGEDTEAARRVFSSCEKEAREFFALGFAATAAEATPTDRVDERVGRLAEEWLNSYAARARRHERTRSLMSLMFRGLRPGVRWSARDLSGLAGISERLFGRLLELWEGLGLFSRQDNGRWSLALPMNLLRHVRHFLSSHKLSPEQMPRHLSRLRYATVLQPSLIA